MTTTVRCSRRLLTAVVILLCASVAAAGEGRVELRALRSPILLRGDETTAYRDPTAGNYEGSSTSISLWFARRKMTASIRIRP